MRIISKLTISVATIATLFVGCSSSISEESLGLRKTNLYVEEAETKGDETKYSKTAAGTSKTITRAFQDAPPMIPHDVDGMLPITIQNNACTSCHAPEVASSLGALSYPKSHMIDFRPRTQIGKDGRISKDGRSVDNTSEEQLEDVSIKSTAGKLAGARFNCSQCHAPQSGATDAPKNTFEAVYTTKDGANKSSWTGTNLMDGINTLK